jgi:hypothetical protein
MSHDHNEQQRAAFTLTGTLRHCACHDAAEVQRRLEQVIAGALERHYPGRFSDLQVVETRRHEQES